MGEKRKKINVGAGGWFFFSSGSCRFRFVWVLVGRLGKRKKGSKKSRRGWRLPLGREEEKFRFLGFSLLCFLSSKLPNDPPSKNQFSMVFIGKLLLGFSN